MDARVRANLQERRETMDDLTKKILADLDDIEAHPQDWRVILKCRECGKTWEWACNKAEVARYREKYGTDILLSHCEKCCPDEQEED